MAFWEKHAPLIFVVSLVLLVLVLLPFIGKVVNFSRRWIPLGFMNFQPSGAGQAGGRDVRRQLHGAQDGREGELLPRRHADGGGGGLRRRAAAAPARHGRLHRHRHHRDGHPLPGRRQRAHVLPDRA
jgi:hypothetical protein